VVDGGAADGGRGEVLLDPGGDLPGRVAAAHGPAHAAHAAAQEVVDPALGHVLLELREGGGGVAAVEAADGHHGVAGGQLHAGGRVRADGGRDPAVAVGVLPEERDQLGVGGAAVEQPAKG